MADKKPYILGTEQAELHRLGLQHQIWTTEASRGWEIAEFNMGNTILDLGCGPGFCTQELAYLVGGEGEVIGVDMSQAYIDFLDELKEKHQLNITAQCTSFDEMSLKDNSLDGAYCRWALAWIPNPEEIVAKVADALKPGGAFVVQEYYDWSVFQSEPRLENLNNVGKPAILNSFKAASGDINIGRRIPEIFEEAGLEVISTRPLAKLATPDDLTWQWPKTFLEIYLPKLVEPGFLTEEELQKSLDDLEDLSHNPNATFLCPLMIEVVGIKM